MSTLEPKSSGATNDNANCANSGPSGVEQAPITAAADANICTKPGRSGSVREFHILNLGAGVQSTALYLMFMREQITELVTVTCNRDFSPIQAQNYPVKLDAAIFADTKEEPIGVYRHLEWLQSLNGPPILVRSAGKLGDDLIAGRASRGKSASSFMDIPAFTTHTGSNGRTKRQCSANYKIRVIEQTIRRDLIGLTPRRSPRGVKVTQYIGISMDEAGRAKRIAAVKRPKYVKVRFPLIEHFMTRANCLTYLADKVPHKTPRSACVFCPFHSDYEWNQQKTEDPAAWSRSIEIEKAMQKHDSTLYLHPSCVPLELVQLDTTPDPRKAQIALNFSAECMGVCGV